RIHIQCRSWTSGDVSGSPKSKSLVARVGRLVACWGRLSKWRPGRDFSASAIRAPLRGHRRPWGHRRHRYWHNALRGGGANRSRGTYAGTRPKQEQNLFVPAAIASCRGIRRYDLMEAPCQCALNPLRVEEGRLSAWRLVLNISADVI